MQSTRISVIFNYIPNFNNLSATKLLLINKSIIRLRRLKNTKTMIKKNCFLKLNHHKKNRVNKNLQNHQFNPNKQINKREQFVTKITIRYCKDGSPLGSKQTLKYSKHHQTKKSKKEHINTGDWSAVEHNTYVNFLLQYENIMNSELNWFKNSKLMQKSSSKIQKKQLIELAKDEQLIEQDPSNMMIDKQFYYHPYIANGIDLKSFLIDTNLKREDVLEYFHPGQFQDYEDYLKITPDNNNQLDY
ncbi:unnamed protein product [Paramecium sonneborni]|uniref:Uncharacterized protein n=1 Tax=Paramecium sonneborni TaxID=65129 RepID=A0A8S1NLK4_9CILI|nr:unnamed protein product [Paramecium sonneborni]